MPEEINRILTDAIADYLFVTEQDAVENLRNEGRPPQAIHLVGNVMIDSLRHFLPIARQSTIGDTLHLRNGANWTRFAVLTLHRPSNVDSTDKLQELLEAIEAIATELPIIFPIHPRTQPRLQQTGISPHRQIRIVPPLGYLDFLWLLSNATMVLTDSGGIQEETTALGVPCLTLRDNTERPVTVTEGTNLLVGTGPGKIIAAAREILAGKSKACRIPPLWDGNASQRIVSLLLQRVSRAESPVQVT